jgi:hypothetical protein
MVPFSNVSKCVFGRDLIPTKCLLLSFELDCLLWRSAGGWEGYDGEATTLLMSLMAEYTNEAVAVGGDGGGQTLCDRLQKATGKVVASLLCCVCIVNWNRVTQSGRTPPCRSQLHISYFIYQTN